MGNGRVIKSTSELFPQEGKKTVLTTSELFSKKPITWEVPSQLQDIAKIASTPPKAKETEPQLLTSKQKLLYPFRRLYSSLIEKPAWSLTELAVRGLRSITSPNPELYTPIVNKFLKKARGWLDKAVEVYSHPEKYALVTPTAEKQQQQLRAQNYQKSFLKGILGDIGEAGTDAMSLISQMFLIRRFAPPKTIASHLKQLGVYGLLTRPGSLPERLKQTSYLLAYNITPYIANATGATGLKAVTVDTLLNTFLTSPTYIKAFKEAGGVNKEFLSLAIPQFVMDVAMAWNTRGLPEKQVEAVFKRYLKARDKALRLEEKEGVEMLKKMQERMDLATGKPTPQTIIRTISRYPEKIKTQEDLQRVGEKMAKDLGIEEKITWRLVKSKTPDVRGLADRRHNIITIYLGYSKPPISFKDKALPEAYEEYVKRVKRYTKKWKLSGYKTASQGKIKKVMLHELIHFLPEVVKERVRGKAHPPAFMKKLEELTPKLYEKVEKKIVYHGTTKDFEQFRVVKEDDTDPVPDRFVGSHFTSDYNTALYFAKGNPKKVKEVAINIKKVYNLPQKENQSDQLAFQIDIARKVFPRRKDLFIRYYSKHRGISKEELSKIYEEIKKGRRPTHKFFHPSKEYSDAFAGLADNYGLLIFDKNLKKEIVNEYRKALQEEGCNVIKYRNTGVEETAKAKVRDAYVVLNSEDIIPIEKAEREVIPKEPPPPSPPEKPESPGYSDPEPPPSSQQLHPLPRWKELAYKFYSIFDVEAPFKAIGAKETGFHIKNFYSYRGAIENRGLSWIRMLTRQGVRKAKEVGLPQLGDEDWMKLTFYTAQPSKMIELDKERYRFYNDLVYTSNQIFKKFAEIAKKEKVIAEEWPQSRINTLQEELRHAKEAGLESEVKELEDAINFLKQDIHYVHIPLRVWLERAFSQNPNQTRRIISTHFRQRETIDIEALARDLLESGAITPKDVDIRTIIGAYTAKLARLAALSRIINSAKSEGLVVKANKRPDWPTFPSRIAPSLKGYRVHPAFWNWLDHFTRRGKERPLARFFSYVKMAQFDNPVFLPFYDLHQAFWLGSLRTIKAPLYVKRAIKSLALKDETYQALIENGLSSKPYIPPFEDFMKSVELARASDNFLNFALTYIKQNAKCPLDLIMKPIWHTAWTGDQLIRLISAYYLLDKGYSIREAAQLAALFHSDYASVPYEVRTLLNKFFFTPIFPITMAKLQTEMVYQTGKLLTQAARLKAPSKKQLALTNGLLGLLALTLMKHLILKKLGYKKDIFGYRYYKTVITEDGEEKELTVSIPAPDNVVLRYYHRFRGWPTTPDEFERKLLRVGFILHPVLSTVLHVACNLQDDLRTPIYNHLDDALKISKDILNYTSGKLIRLKRRIDEIGEKSHKKKALLAFKKDVGKLYYLLLRPVCEVYLRETKSVRDRAKMINLMKKFQYFMQRKPPESEEEVDRMYRKLEEGLRSLME